MQFEFCLLKYYYSYQVNEIICIKALHKDLYALNLVTLRKWSIVRRYNSSVEFRERTLLWLRNGRENQQNGDNSGPHMRRLIILLGYPRLYLPPFS